MGKTQVDAEPDEIMRYLEKLTAELDALYDDYVQARRQRDGERAEHIHVKMLSVRQLRKALYDCALEDD